MQPNNNTKIEIIGIISILVIYKLFQEPHFRNTKPKFSGHRHFRNTVLHLGTQCCISMFTRVFCQTNKKIAHPTGISKEWQKHIKWLLIDKILHFLSDKNVLFKRILNNKPLLTLFSHFIQNICNFELNLYFLRANIVKRSSY